MSPRASPWPLRVLVADGHRDAADSLALLLKLWGFSPLAAYDAPTALGLLVPFEPEALLVEVRLPGAFGLASRARLLGGRGLLLVAVTTAAGPGALERSRAAGFDAHLVKPIEPDELRALLAHAALKGKA